MDKLLTAKELSELLQVDQSTVYKWSHLEFIPHVKLGRSVRFDPAAVGQWVRQRSHQGRKTMRYPVDHAA